MTGRWIASQGLRFDEAYSSDLSRARVVRSLCLRRSCNLIADSECSSQTAETILSAQPQAPQLQLDERIRERVCPPPTTLLTCRRSVETEADLALDPSFSESCRFVKLEDRSLSSTSADPCSTVMQGKRRGDPGADPTTVEPIPQLRGRLWHFWDSLFPPAGPAASSSASVASSTSPSPDTAAANRQVLYVSHGAAIREFILSLASQDVLPVEKGGGRSFDLLLPEQEAAAIRAGSKRIDNCSRTVIEMEWLEDENDRGACYAVLRFPRLLVERSGNPLA